MNIKTTFFSLLAVSLLTLVAPRAQAQTDLVGINTSGDVYQINTSDGTLTLKAQEAVTTIDLGAIARKKNLLFYVAAPSGSSENSLFKVSISTGAITKVDLDRNDTAKSLFFNGNKLYGIFYNSSTGDSGVYKINITTGATTLLVDLSAINAEPLGGAIARQGAFFHTIVKPTEETRQLLRFKLKANSAVVNDIKSPTGTDIKCDKIKPHPSLPSFVCVASTSSTQVDVCKLSLKGVARCGGTLTSIIRIGSGHTMMRSGKRYYVFGYAAGEPNNQRLVSFNAAGKELASPAIANGSLFVGARFGIEDTEGDPQS